MNLASMLAVALSLAADAFAVSVATGIASERVHPMQAMKVGLFFGGFQGVMPLLGSCLGAVMSAFVSLVDHWLAFGLLSFIGARMIVEGFRGGGQSAVRPDRTLELTILAVATSLDALAVGIGLAAVRERVEPVALLTSLVTACLCILGVCLGKKLGDRFLGSAMRLGGAALCITGMRILIEHLM